MLHMDFQQLVKERFSVRDFTADPVTTEQIKSILETTALAPSAVNFQPWHFIVITAGEMLEKLWNVYHREWIRKAPVIIVACVNRKESWKRGNDGKDFGDIDVAIAVDHLTLAASAAGLGTCWVCNFDAVRCRELLQLPLYLEPLVLIPLGVPASAPPPKKRKPLSETVTWRG